MRADPTVCVCWGDGRPCGPPDVVAAGIIGGKGDCTVFSDGVSASGGEGKKARSGMFRNGVDELGRRMLYIRW